MANDVPFANPLLAILLRGYFIEGNPKQDQLLIARLKDEQSIPIPLIAMGTALESGFPLCSCDLFNLPLQIGHALQEYASGSKVEHNFSVKNLGARYVYNIISGLF